MLQIESLWDSKHPSSTHQQVDYTMYIYMCVKLSYMNEKQTKHSHYD